MFALLVGFLLAERLVELTLSERNRRWAIAQGAVESGRAHYPLLVALHALFYVALITERIGRGHGWGASGWDPLWPLWLALFAGAQALRVWAIASLGRRWNTRILVIPGLDPIARGPYRFIRHPNYLVVMVEIAVIPLMCGAYWTAALFSAANALLLAVRIRAEERALAGATRSGLQPLPRFIPRAGVYNRRP